MYAPQNEMHGLLEKLDRRQRTSTRIFCEAVNGGV